MSREYHLITRDRPGNWAFVRTLTEAAGHNVDVKGDFENADDYLNVSADDLWIEIEPPGHVEAADLEGMYEDVVLPQPDDEGCLWLTVASVPAGAPAFGTDVISLTFRRLAATHHGVTVE
jgi:hypothetical protein